MNPPASAPSPQPAPTSARGGRSSSPSSPAASESSPSPASASTPPSLAQVLQGEARAVVIAIPATPEFVRVVRLSVAGVATRMRFSYEQIEDIKLAVSEACNNAILHAQPPGGEAPTQVIVRILPAPERLEITVFDQGHLPSPGLSLPEPGAGSWASLDDLPEGGMGLMLIQSIMDEVSSHAGEPHHTALHMVKRLHPL